jgi:hypothetical protein
MKDTENQLEAVQYQRFWKKKVPKINEARLYQHTAETKTEARRSHPRTQEEQRPANQQSIGRASAIATTLLEAERWGRRDNGIDRW